MSGDEVTKDHDASDINFNPDTAVAYGLFVQAAYDMYDADPTNPKPTRSFPDAFRLYLTIQMTETFTRYNDRLFYGFFAQSKTDPNAFVVAIRGTRTLKEAWNDIDWSLARCDIPGGMGYVANGFLSIYKTGGYMTPSGDDESRPLREAFSRLPKNVPPGLSMTVTGHSLGAALVTLFALERISISILKPTVYTFASPRVGDLAFVAQFNDKVPTSHRIYNWLDPVPYFPKNPFDNYYHVNRGQEIDSGWDVDPLDPLCTHALNTYLYELSNHKVPLSGSCKWTEPTDRAAYLSRKSPL